MYLMECGHVASAHDTAGHPYCAACLGIYRGAHVVVKQVEGTEGLEGRKAQCYGHKGGEIKLVDSKWGLPFFRYMPHEQYDSYYCGCWGWD